MASRALSSQPKVIHVIRNPELFITSRVLSSERRTVYIIHHLERFIKSRGMSRILNCSYHPQL